MPHLAKSSTSLGSLKSAHVAKGRDLRRDDLAKRRMKALLFDEPDFSMRLDAIDQHHQSMQHLSQRSQSSKLHNQSSRSVDLRPAPGMAHQQKEVSDSMHQDKTLSSLKVDNELITFDPHPPGGKAPTGNDGTQPTTATTSSSTSTSTSPSSGASSTTSSSATKSTQTNGAGTTLKGLAKTLAASVGVTAATATDNHQSEKKDKIGSNILVASTDKSQNTNLMGKPHHPIGQQPPDSAPPARDTMANPISSTAGAQPRTHQQYQANLGGVTAAGTGMSAMDHSIDAMIKSLTDHPMLANASRLKNEQHSMKDNFELISSSNFIRYHGYRMHRFMNSILSANFDLKRSSSHTFDLKIEVENEVYFVHKFIVESQVPHIIDKMIDISDNSIKKASLITRIELRNISNDGFKPIYQFIYGGHVEPSKENFLPTLDAAIRLFMIDFARIWICEFALQFKTKVKWVSTLIKVTKLYSWKDEEIKMRKLKFKLVQEETGHSEEQQTKGANQTTKSLSLNDPKDNVNLL